MPPLMLPAPTIKNRLINLITSSGKLPRTVDRVASWNNNLDLRFLVIARTISGDDHANDGRNKDCKKSQKAG